VFKDVFHFYFSERDLPRRSLLSVLNQRILSSFEDLGQINSETLGSLNYSDGQPSLLHLKRTQRTHMSGSNCFRSISSCKSAVSNVSFTCIVGHKSLIALEYANGLSYKQLF